MDRLSRKIRITTTPLSVGLSFIGSGDWEPNIGILMSVNIFICKETDSKRWLSCKCRRLNQCSWRDIKILVYVTDYRVLGLHDLVQLIMPDGNSHPVKMRKSSSFLFDRAARPHASQSFITHGQLQCIIIPFLHMACRNSKLCEK